MSLIDVTGGFYKLPLTTSLAIPIALISIFCVMFTVNDSEVVDCWHEHMLFDYLHFHLVDII